MESTMTVHLLSNPSTKFIQKAMHNIIHNLNINLVVSCSYRAKVGTYIAMAEEHQNIIVTYIIIIIDYGQCISQNILIGRRPLIMPISNFTPEFV